MANARTSKRVYVPSAVSSFFEICDRNANGSKITDELQIGARGGGLVLRRGNTTRASIADSKADSVYINHKRDPSARTSLKVIELMRKDFKMSYLRINHDIEPPVGAGFGTSGAGAIGATLAIADLFKLNLTLRQVSDYAHRAEIESVTGLGTVISLISGIGAIGLVLEPGSFSIGRVDSIPVDYSELTAICACFGPIEKSTVLRNAKMKKKVNQFGRKTLEAIMEERTPTSLLLHSRAFAENTGIASETLLRLADRAVECGAIGATQNMIGNAIHCLVRKKDRRKFLASFLKLVPLESIFESELAHSGPRIM